MILKGTLKNICVYMYILYVYVYLQGLIYECVWPTRVDRQPILLE